MHRTSRTQGTPFARPQRHPQHVIRTAGLLLATTVSAASLAATAHAASPVPLGTADSFALLAGSTITNTGPSTIFGDIGLCCTGLATPGFGPGANQVTQPSGAQYIGPGSVAATAQDDLDSAYFYAASQAVTNTVPVDLSLTGTPANPLRPGVYESTAHGALQINTGLTLDFQGDPNAVFIFQGTTLTTAAAAGGSVTIVNGGSAPSACNITWQLSDATQGVTLGTASAFKGTTMALGASVLGTAATVDGRILTRRSKAVSLDTNTITRTACFGAIPAAAGGGTTPGATTPAGGSPATDTTPQIGTPQPNSPVTPVPSGTATAQISGPAGPVSAIFPVSVTGREIELVRFYIDGRRLATVKAKQGRKKFKVMINPRGRSRRVHIVTARVHFTPASRTRATTRRVTFRRTSAPRFPRFAG
ncbi:MAG TPA: ice-binding family protein [Solirubrobacteraceae bacterium]|nr:ice-binding family protein [Solirubrobacteraceae bacterium]